MAELRRIAMYRAISRSFLLMGAERELLLLLLLACATLVFSLATLVSAIIGVVVAIIGTFLLRKMAKADPLMTKVFLRYWNRYRQTYYPPRARMQGQGHLSRSKP